jgi:hypothetical protein
MAYSQPRPLFDMVNCSALFRTRIVLREVTPMLTIENLSSRETQLQWRLVRSRDWQAKISRVSEDNRYI